jgi:hypothetical protein
MRVKGPRAKARGLVGSTAVVVPTSPTLTRLSYGGPGQAMEVATLTGSPRPTSACFLSTDRSNLRLQTNSGSCTKRIGELALPVNSAEGREPERSVWLRYARRLLPGGRWVSPRKGHRVGVGGHALPAPWAQPTRARRARSGPQHVPSASAFLCRLEAKVSSGGFL